MAIDRLELTVNPEIPLTSEFEYEYSRVRRTPSPLYKEKANLRKIGLNAILFRYCRFNATHKLVLVGAGNMTLQEMATLVRQVFDCDPWEARIARVDFAVDLQDVSMVWIREHIRVPWKRVIREYGFRAQADDQRPGATLSLGSWVDLFRFYDKKAQNIKKSRNVVPLLQPGSGCDGSLSRIERQLGTGRIPSEMSTLAELRENALSFNPFAPIKFMEGGKARLRPKDYTCGQYLEGTTVRGLIQRDGFARTWQFLNENWGGNAGRTIARLADFIPPDPEGFQLPDLVELHRASLNYQLRDSAENYENALGLDCSRSNGGNL